MANSMPRDEMNPSNDPIDPSGERVDSARADARMPGDEMNPVLNQPAKTGRFLVVFSEGATEEGIKVLSNKAGIQVSEANESDESDRDRVYHALGVAVISPDPDRVSAIASASAERNSPILTMEEEQIARVEPIIGVQETEEDAAWGLIATQVTKSPYSGRGIKIAILDTGLDLKHPDFADRKIISQSFVEGQAVQDGHGHGTHTTGTACGPREPSTFERYGVACEAEIYVGKVLKNDGSGPDRSILDGINWAIANGCQIISMSIGGLVSVGSSYSYTYEVVASRALEQNTLIIVAAGNNSKRTYHPPIINPVSRPANCPSMMGVGAIDRNLAIASFSNGYINTEYEGGEVDLVGPGVNVYSSWPSSRYKSISGTSMATPHVAGIAALYAQANPKARGKELWDLLINNVQPLTLAARDVGAGLVRAPQ